jgi:hypothetical protein
MELPVPIAVNSETVGTFAAAVGEVSLEPGVVIPPGAVLHGRARPPLMIDREEAYYWTTAWQDGVRDALAALVSGKFRRFDSEDPLDLARWLLDDSEE